ncbi:MAG: hypothetical protein AAGA30_17765 [Planctomycetota bacterium]
MTETGRVSATANLQLGKAAVEKNAKNTKGSNLPVRDLSVIRDTLETGERESNQAYLSRPIEIETSEQSENHDDGIGERLDVWG